MDYREVLKADTVLDRKYRIDRVIGAGGFGITYQAFDLGLAAPVAIKEYYPAQFGMRDTSLSVRARSESDRPLFDRLRSSFLREARTLAQFDHPAIVRVLSVFETHGTAYMVMRFESGPSLKSWLQNLGRSPRQQELDRLLWPLLDAIDLMHKADFLHRDIAPDNIIVRVDGTPVLLDFGASRRVITDMSGTLTGVVKQGYSPQEQYSSDVRAQGPWTDIYSLGATLYLCVTGKVPTEATARMLEDGMMPALDGARGGFRPEFLAAIDAAMQLHPRNRPQSVAEWREMLFQGAEPGWYPEGGDGFLEASTGPGGIRVPASTPRSGPGGQARSQGQSSPRTGGRSQPRPEAQATSQPRTGGAATAGAASSPLVVDSVASPSRPTGGVSRPLASRATDFALSTRGAIVLGVGALLFGGSMLLAFERGDRSGAAALSGYGQTTAAQKELERQAELARQQKAEQERAAAARLEAERQAEVARQQKTAQERAEAARREQERQAEVARQQKAEQDRAEAARREQERQAEVARQQKAEQDRAEAARREQERQAELARQQKAEQDRAEAVRREQERQAEQARQQQLERQRVADAAAAAAKAAAEAQRRQQQTQQTPAAGPAPIRQVAFADATREPGQFAQRLASAPGLFLAGGNGGQLRLWSATGQIADLQARHAAPVSAVAVLADGSRIASGSADGDVRIWDARSRALLQTIAGGRGAVVAVHYRTARRVLAIHATGTWAIIDPENGQTLMTGTRNAGGSVTAADFSSDGKTIFAAVVDAAGVSSVEGWIPADGSVTRQASHLVMPGGPVTAVAAAADGRQLATAGADGVVRLWDIDQGREVRQLARTASPARALAFSRSGTLVAGAGADGATHVWQTSDGVLVASFAGSSSGLTAVSFADDGAGVAAAGEDGLIRQWALPAALVLPTPGREPSVQPAALVVPRVTPPPRAEEPAAPRPPRVKPPREEPPRQVRSPPPERRSPPPERRNSGGGGGGGGGGSRGGGGGGGGGGGVRIPAF